MQKRFILMTAALCALALSACGGDSDSATPERGGVGLYTAAITGDAIGSAQVYTPATEAGPASIEKLRTATGQPEYTYLNLDVDNTKGKNPVSLQEIQVLDASGKMVTFKLGFNQVGDLDNLIPADNTALYNESVGTYNEFLKGKTTLAGQRQTVTYVADERIEPAKVQATMFGPDGPYQVKFSRV